MEIQILRAEISRLENILRTKVTAIESELKNLRESTSESEEELARIAARIHELAEFNTTLTGNIYLQFESLMEEINELKNSNSLCTIC